METLITVDLSGQNVTPAGRALDCDSGGREFESRFPLILTKAKFKLLGCCLGSGFQRAYPSG